SAPTISITGTVGKPTIRNEAGPGPNPYEAAHAHTKAQVVTKSSSSYDKGRNETHLVFEYGIRVEGSTITFYQGASPGQPSGRDPSKTLLQHEQAHLEFSKRWYTSEVQGILFFESDIPTSIDVAGRLSPRG